MNALWSAVCSIISGLSLFLSYKFILSYVGAPQLGLWALIVSYLSLAKIADLGFPGAIVKLVAQNNFPELKSRASTYLWTGIFFSIFFVVPSVILIYYLLLYFSPGGLSSHRFESIKILPLAAFGTCLMLIGNGFRSGLDALQRIDLRQAAVCTQPIFFMLSCFFFVPKNGLYGVALAQCVSAGISLFLSVYLLLYVSRLENFSLKFSMISFLPLFRYGLPFQSAGISVIFVDPIVKSMLLRFGTISDVTWYDMSTKFILQLRVLLMGALESIVPYMAGLSTASTNFINNEYKRISAVNSSISFCFFSLLLSTAPIVGLLWLGSLSKSFIMIYITITIFWWINSLSAPAYYFNQGLGTQKNNVITHLIQLIFCAILCYFLGIFYSSFGVILGWGISLSLSSLITIYSFHSRNNIQFLNVKLKRLFIGIAIISGIAIGEVLNRKYLLSISISLSVFVIVISYHDVNIKNIIFKILNFKRVPPNNN